MTIFAGAFSLDGLSPLPAELCASLRRHVSRSEETFIAESSAPGFYLAKVDIGAFDAPGLLSDDNGSVTAVAGEPLVAQGEGVEGWDRADDVAALHADLAQGSLQVLSECRGTHCGVHFNAVQRTLALFVDQAGVRPVFLWVGEHYAVFATALRILKAVPQVPKKFDVRGVAEIAAYTYPLAERTAFEGILALKAGEAVTISGGKVAREAYYRWDDRQQTSYDAETAVGKCYAEFISGMKRRQGGAPRAAAFLSGGLDSRAIVGGLAAIGTEVHTVNYAPDQTQDQVFAAMVADKLGTVHTQVQTNAANVAQGYRKNAVLQWMQAEFPEGMSDRPKLMWSGDGGSVALGHVYMTRPIVEAMRQNDYAKAIKLFNDGIAARILTPSQRQTVAGFSGRGGEEELAAIACTDPGRKFHLFLMFNDQRRHLAAHFENIDLERIEFELPFFDARFLDSILRMPCDPYMEHLFYMEWLAKFPNALDAIPWQAYPGHVQCTLPAPPGLKYQWEDYYDKKMAREMTLAKVSRGVKLLKGERFPAHLISRSTLLMAVAATRLGVRDLSYLIDVAATFCDHWHACDPQTAH
jgi:hypothetical protein